MRACCPHAPVIIGVSLLLGGCTTYIVYRPDYVPERPVTDSERVEGRVLIYTTKADDERVILAPARSFTGSALNLSIPIGAMTREIAVKVFSTVADGGAEAHRELSGLNRYAVVLQPQAQDFTYWLQELRNLGFAMTPQVRLSMRMTLLDGAGKPLLQKEYDSGRVSGSTSVLANMPFRPPPYDQISRLAHETLGDLMRRAAVDVHGYQQASQGPMRRDH
jgi:hypothetical protein